MRDDELREEPTVRHSPATSLAWHAPERILARDRVAIFVAMIVLVALAWIHVVSLARNPRGMGTAMVMPSMSAWGGTDLVMLFAMWTVMMVAMMLTSATPLVLLFATIARRRRERRSPAAPTSALVMGYLVAWTGFSALAALVQWELHRMALLSPTMVSTSPTLGALVLIGAGVYQWTPLKGRCLSECRSPLGFITREWREGIRGALVMGARHGAFCVGCCWGLMALLFVAGVMNLAWIVGLAAFVLVEKLAPTGPRLGRLAGIVLVSWGGWILMRQG